MIQLNEPYIILSPFQSLKGTNTTDSVTDLLPIVNKLLLFEKLTQLIFTCSSQQ